MSSTYRGLHFHLVFATIGRQRIINSDWRPRLHEYIGGIVRGLGGTASAIGGVEDHVHVLASIRPVHRLADILRDLKKATSVWSAEQFEPRFAWQEGYSAFSVSPTHLAAVRGYIGRQEEHHRQIDFKEELRHLLERSGVQYDPKHLP